MTIDDAIRQRGFRRWYERQLIEGHIYLVGGVLALFGALVAIEMTEFRGPIGELLVTLASAAAGGFACVYALRRFSRLLGTAEHLAGQANCPQCKTYARFRLVQAFDVPTAIEGRALKVRCRVCANEWTIG
jgi:hypothetical protein